MSEGKPSARQRTPVPGHPGIYRKGSAFQVRWKHHGQEKTRSFRTLTEARRHKAKVDAGDTQATSRTPFARYAEAWIEEYTGRTGRGVSEVTRESYRDALTRFAVPFFKTTPLDRIDPPMLRRFIKSLSVGHTPNTVRCYYAPVRALLATAYDDGLLRANPAAGVRVIVKDTRERKPRWLTPDETRALLREMPERDAELAFFLAATGCRIGEALAAQWSDVGRSAGGAVSFRVRRSKTEAGLRTIPLSPETSRRLTRLRTETPFARDDDPIFPSRVGTVRDARNYRTQVFRPAAARAGVPWATPHMLRHGLASLMANHGYSPAQIAAHLGHADGGVLALRTYVHPGALASVDFVDAALA